LLDRMMARDRGERFADAAALHAALNGAIAILTPSNAHLDAGVTLQ
jgi:hypothetical protein